jgi:AcrR family transcriptional regulator
MGALADEIVERGLADLAVPSVAERAGVSVRTVYNHFENRDVLVGSFNEWVSEKMAARGGVLVETDPDRMADAIRLSFALFSDLGTIGEALARIQSGGGNQGHLATTARLAAQRTEAVSQALAAARPDLDERETAALTAALRLVMSFDTWDRLTYRFGLTGEEAGTVAAWMFETLFAAVRQDHTPFDNRPGFDAERRADTPEGDNRA